MITLHRCAAIIMKEVTTDIEYIFINKTLTEIYVAYIFYHYKYTDKLFIPLNNQKSLKHNRKQAE